MTTKEKNMTTGSPARLLLFFAVPLMLSSIFQQLYTMVDTIVVGQYIGVEALAALGATEWINWMAMSMILGMTEGFSIMAAQKYGANDGTGLKKVVANSYMLTAIITVAVVLIGQLAIRQVMEILKTPENVFDDALLYVRLRLWGLPFVAAYNVFSAMLRGVGNSKAPLQAMSVASVINIVLDVLFVRGFGYGIASVAVATIIAQILSVLVCYVNITKIDRIHIRLSDFHVDKNLMSGLFRLGIPLSIQNIIISVGGMVIQSVVNGFGFIYLASYSAANKLYGLLELASTSYGYALTTYVGQNMGAGKNDRIKKGVHTGVILAVLTALAVSLIMVVFGKNILSLFITEKNDTKQVLDIAYRYLSSMSAFLFTLYVAGSYKSSIQGLGYTMIPFLNGLIELVMRLILPGIMISRFGKIGIFYVEGGTWACSAVIMIVCYYIIMYKKKI